MIPSLKAFTTKATIRSVGIYLNTLALARPVLAGKKAFSLFCTPRKGQLSDKDNEFLQSATQQTIEMGKLKIRVNEWAGEGKTVLLAHGWESNSARWRRFIVALRKEKYHIISLDAPAHGGTTGSKFFTGALYGDAIDTVAKKFDANIIISHSVGGFSTGYCMSKYALPSVEKLVFLATPLNLMEILGNFQNTLQLSTRTMQGLYTHFERSFDKSIPNFSVEKLIDKNPLKTLIVHDKQDAIVAYSNAELLHDHLPNSRLITTDGFGHSINTMEVVKEVLKFLSDK
jgi:pimeloyl-ACP methyl ester carboxylesterase